MVALAAPAWAQARLALVIGNSAYATAPLANPRNDAELIARTLRHLGFEVTRLHDADQKTMRRALIDFGRRLKAADAVGVFYFAGHGVQVEGENYLIPIGAEIREEREVALEAVSATEVLRSFQTSSKRLSITILDACRNNPYAAATRSGVRGLAGMNAPSGTLVSYATAPGQVAMDGDGANSPFAEALAQSMLQAGLLVEDVFKRTRRLVLAKTGERQVPWESSS
ncbi:MAG: caspase family protein, partial [Hyphomicrobiales bacterium]|nr:caspase family protein [Hyphomicrobiales bacterium]